MKLYEIIQEKPVQVELREVMGLEPKAVAAMTIHLEPVEPVKVYIMLPADKRNLAASFSMSSEATQDKP